MKKKLVLFIFVIAIILIPTINLAAVTPEESENGKTICIDHNINGINNLYVKLDGNKDGYGLFWRLFGKLNINVNEVSEIELDMVNSEKKTININKASSNCTRICDIEKIIINDETFVIKELGDVWQNDDTENGNININDVIAMRRAITGDTNILNSPYFKIENTDVDFSNGEYEQLGDVGDIIYIRQRIMTKNWHYPNEINTVSEIDGLRMSDINIEYHEDDNETYTNFVINNDLDETVNGKTFNVKLYKNDEIIGSLPSYIENINSDEIYYISIVLRGNLTEADKVVISDS